jgi:hypothetical protein
MEVITKLLVNLKRKLLSKTGNHPGNNMSPFLNTVNLRAKYYSVNKISLFKKKITLFGLYNEIFSPFLRLPEEGLLFIDVNCSLFLYSFSVFINRVI